MNIKKNKLQKLWNGIYSLEPILDKEISKIKKLKNKKSLSNHFFKYSQNIIVPEWRDLEIKENNVLVGNIDINLGSFPKIYISFLSLIKILPIISTPKPIDLTNCYFNYIFDTEEYKDNYSINIRTGIIISENEEDESVPLKWKLYLTYINPL